MFGRWLAKRILPTMVALILGLNLPLTGYAKITACRGDPIIDIGIAQIQSIVEIQTSLDNVDRVEFTYYVPFNATLPVMFDASPLAAKERVKFVKVASLSDVRIEAIVYLKPGVKPVAVTTTTNIIPTVASLMRLASTKSIVGTTGQILTYKP
jgi:hypothetical protein